MPAIKDFIGTSGYSYQHWADGIFYPRDCPSDRWLNHYSQIFNAVELNVTFYRLVSPATMRAMMNRTPNHFRFTVKGSRFMTHFKYLSDAQEPLQRFAESLQVLRPKLNCVLWQLPPHWKKHRDSLQGFCAELNKQRLLKGIHQVFEFRHPSWFCDETYHLLKMERMGLCFADSPDKLGERVVTSDFLYLRFHGDRARYASGYSSEALQEWVEQVWALRQQVRTVYAFFNNDARGYAPRNAVTFREQLHKKMTS